MKQIVLVAITLIVSLTSYSQSYSFKKVFTQVSGLPASFLKLNGQVTISDTLVTLVQNGQKSEIVVSKISPSQYKSKISEDHEIRFTLSTDPTKKENDNFLLTMETKDRFSGSYSTFLYYLSPLKQ